MSSYIDDWYKEQEQLVCHGLGYFANGTFGGGDYLEDKIPSAEFLDRYGKNHGKL